MKFASLSDVRAVAVRAVRQLQRMQHVRARIYVSGDVVRRGQRLGPKVQGTRARRGGILAFCDLEPDASFAHACCYLLFDPRTKRLVERIDARYPPYPRGIPDRYFKVPILSAAKRGAQRALPVSLPISVSMVMQQPFMLLAGRKYALLYSGSTNISHLNDLDSCYKVLGSHGFRATDILVCNFDGTLNASDLHADTRAASLGGYQLVVTGDGRAATFLAALERLGQQLTSNDLLFIYTTGHGDRNSTGHYLLDFDEQRLTAENFSTALRQLPAHQSLVAVMQQCCSGGFESSVFRGSRAAQTSFTASTAPNRLAGARDKRPFYSFFTWDWLGALNSAYLDGTPLLFPIPANRPVSVKDAFGYAVRQGVVHSPDKPQHSSAPLPAADALTLS